MLGWSRGREDRAQAGGLVDEVTMVTEYNRAVADLAMEAAEATPGVDEAKPLTDGSEFPAEPRRKS